MIVPEIKSNCIAQIITVGLLCRIESCIFVQMKEYDCSRGLKKHYCSLDSSYIIVQINNVAFVVQINEVTLLIRLNYHYCYYWFKWQCYSDDWSCINLQIKEFLFIKVVTFFLKNINSWNAKITVIITCGIV